MPDFLAPVGATVTSTLANGLSVVVEPLPFARSVSIGCVIRAGSGYDTPSTSGIAHLTEHLLFRGSKSLPSALDIAVAAERMGAEIDAYTDHEHAVFHVRTHPEGLREAAGMLADLLIRPELRDADFEPERDVVLGEIRDSAENPADEAQHLVEFAAFGEHPLGWGIAGSVASVSGITNDQARHYWERHYTAVNCVLTVAGAVAPSEALPVAEHAFGEMPPGVPVTRAQPSAYLPGPDLSTGGPQSDRATIALALPGYAVHDPARWAMRCFNAITGGSMSSRLFQEVRGRLGISYQIRSQALEHADTGMWLVTASFGREDVPAGLAAVSRVLGQVQRGEFTADEVRRVAQHASRSIDLLMEDTWAVAERNGVELARHGGVASLNAVLDGYGAVDLDAVRSVATQVTDADRLHVAVLGVPTDGLLQLMLESLG
jgi:predicted Zn-dependent peptidase